MQVHTSDGTIEQGRSVATTLALGLGTFLILFDVTAVVVAMPAVAKDVGLGVSGLAWVIDAYSLAFTGALLASGALADRFGRRRCMLVGNAVFLMTISLALAIDALLRRDGSLAVRAACLVASATSAFLFIRRQRRSPHPVLDPRVFATSAMIGVAVLLTALQFGYWAVLVYLPLFLGAALQISMEAAGATLLVATLPMLVVPLIGGRLVMLGGWQRLFAIALGLVTLGDVVLVIAALSEGAVLRLAATVAGMATIGVGAALANPQLSGVVLALVPSMQVGMASAVIMIVRQAGFAIGIAALGATLGVIEAAAEFAYPFALASFVASLGLVAALVLIPVTPVQQSG